MPTGVKLRCLNSPNRLVVAGRSYEVAEILEHPGHVMVRKPDGKWPKPGEWYFAMHADEYFESPRQGIPAFSCGFEYVDMQFFGAIVPNSLFPTPPKWDFNKPSTQRACERISGIVERDGGEHLWWHSYYNVLPRVCFPESLKTQFMLIGMDYRNLGGRAGKQRTFKTIQNAMRRLGISRKSMPPIEDQLVEFWHPSWRKAGPLTWKSPKRWTS
jgi:hypothetical protein